VAILLFVTATFITAQNKLLKQWFSTSGTGPLSGPQMALK